jgi:acyl carrier protein
VPEAQSAEISKRIHALVEQIAPHRDGLLSADVHLERDLHYDSLAFVELAVAIESEFGLPPLREEEALDVETVGDVERLVEQALAGNR